MFTVTLKQRFLAVRAGLRAALRALRMTDGAQLSKR
jgi:hypothetical protein